MRELATYERAPKAVVTTADDFVRHGFGERPLFRALVAEWDGAPAGFALYFIAFSTWTGPVLYLEDMFVRPEHRKHGIGRSLMQRLRAKRRTPGAPASSGR